MRTPAQILERIALVEQTDSMGSQLDILILALPYEDAKPFIDESVTPAQWLTDCPELHDAACEALIVITSDTKRPILLIIPSTILTTALSFFFSIV